MSLVSNQRGQFITEAVLILLMFVGITFLVAKTFRDQEYVKTVIQSPWRNLAGLLQNGVWQSPDRSMTSHPNANGRHVSIQGERP